MKRNSHIKHVRHLHTYLDFIILTLYSVKFGFQYIVISNRDLMEIKIMHDIFLANLHVLFIYFMVFPVY